MISKEAMDLARERGAEAGLAHYGLSKSAAPMGMVGTLQQGIQRIQFFQFVECFDECEFGIQHVKHVVVFHLLQ